MNLVQMDVRDKALIDFLLQEKFDTVIHLAAQTLVPFPWNILWLMRTSTSKG